MDYEPTYNSIRQQQYRTGIVKRTPNTTVTRTSIKSIAYTTLLFIVLIVLPSIVNVQ